MPFHKKPNYQLSGCVPRWPICLAVRNYGFSQCFFSSRPFSFWLDFSRVLQSTNSVTLPEISCHSNPMHFSSCLQRKEPQLNPWARTNRTSIPAHVNDTESLTDAFFYAFCKFDHVFYVQKSSQIFYTLESNNFPDKHILMLNILVQFYLFVFFTVADKRVSRDSCHVIMWQKWNIAKALHSN